MSLELDAEQLQRYSRQLLVDDVGPAGQQRLLESAVLVVGAGGLGSPALQYLAAAGVGRIGIVDDDIVEMSNLQRQVVHTVDDVGRPKVDSAAEFVEALNPNITVDQLNRRMEPESGLDLIAEYDVVVDGSDNFPTRYLLNDACVLADVPLCQGAVFQFEGQVTTFAGGRPCYRCLFPEAPPADAVPDCATAGVLGVVPGTIGTLQATEAVKVLTEVGTPLVGRLLVFNARTMQMETVAYEADADCAVCSPDRGIETLADVEYSTDCSIRPS